jgi:hypothetical protein
VLRSKPLSALARLSGTVFAAHVFTLSSGAQLCGRQVQAMARLACFKSSQRALDGRDRCGRQRLADLAWLNGAPHMHKLANHEDGVLVIKRRLHVACAAH